MLELGGPHPNNPSGELEGENIEVQFLHMASCLEVYCEAMEELANDEELKTFMRAEQSHTKHELRLTTYYNLEESDLHSLQEN